MRSTAPGSRQGAAGMAETIRFAGLELRFLRDKEETGGSLDLFEMTVQPNARMPVAHYHEGWEETVYGLAGVTTWRVDGSERHAAGGDAVHPARGRPRLPQRHGRAGDVPVRADAGGARAGLFPGAGDAGGGRGARSGQGEGDHAAAWAGAGSGRLVARSSARRMTRMGALQCGLIGVIRRSW